jgi:hypothetical protein
MAFNFLKQAKKNFLSDRDVIQIRGENIIFNSKGLIPAIVQKLEGKETEVIDLIYMNEQMERLGLESEMGFRIKSIKIGKKHRSLLITVGGDEKLKNRQSFQIEIFK